MKLVILLCFIVCTAADLKHPSDRNSELFKYNPSDVYTLPEDIDDEKPAVIFEGNVMRAKVEKLQNFNGNKKFKLDLKTQNGIEVTSVGKLKDDKTFVVSGSYSFTGADGKRYKTRYTADEFGYHPITELDLDIPDGPLNSFIPKCISVFIFISYHDLPSPGTGRNSDIPFHKTLKNFTFTCHNFGLAPSQKNGSYYYGPQPIADAARNPNKFDSSNKDLLGGLKNRFQFLNQNLNLDISGSAQSGDDYKYSATNNNGYNYEVPIQQFETSASIPSREYLPVK